jgi:sulfur transfer complex TusBCD TusB component (DsrH family)
MALIRFSVPFERIEVLMINFYVLKQKLQHRGFVENLQKMKGVKNITFNYR